MPMPDPFERRRRGAVIAAAATAVVLTAAAVMQFIGPSPEKLKGQVFGEAEEPAEPEPSASRLALGAGPSPAVLDSSDFDKLVELFADSAEIPAAAAFAKEFMREPELKKDWEEFKADQKSEPPKDNLQSFAQRLSEKAEFRALVARYAQDPGFRDVGVRLSQNPQLQEAIRNVLASARAAPPSLRPPSGALGARRGGAASETSQGAKAWGGRGPQFARTMDPGARVDTATAESEGGRRKVNLGGGGQAGDVITSSTTDQPSAPDAHAVKAKLEDFERDPANEEMDKVLEAWLAKHGLNAQTYMSEQGGIWDVCFKRGELKRCHEACEDQPTTISTLARAYCAKPSGDAPYWQACLQAYEDEARCLAECQAQNPPCEVPDDVIRDRCFTRITPPTCTAALELQAFNRLPVQCGVLRESDPGGVDCDGSDGSTSTSSPAATSYRKAILGFTREPDGVLKVDREEQRIIREVFELFLQLKDVRKVAAALKSRYNDKDDFNNKRGSPLDTNSIAQLLKRPQYAAAGYLPAGVYEQVTKRRKDHGVENQR